MDTFYGVSEKEKAMEEQFRRSIWEHHGMV